MSNHLEGQTSPYLIQHKDNPVNWYPWCKDAFIKARSEDKPIFLSIGYSTCHWCHVMAHESFESEDIAGILNEYFVAIKVDKEERPDIDSVYMTVCQAFTGSGGWPMSIFMTADQRPFFAGTYFPNDSRYGMIGFRDLLLAIHNKWLNDRKSLLQASTHILSSIDSAHVHSVQIDQSLPGQAFELFKRSFDKKYGGFGSAPKFPSPHNLLFLMKYAHRYDDKDALDMVETTLKQMYRGGIFDHIGYGFCRYSTDRYYLVPHFEKMLYDNALLIITYCKAYEMTGKQLYLEIAEKTVAYILSEMSSPQGGFYSAQDADSDGIEGKYYLFTVEEIKGLLGNSIGQAFCDYYGITESGNFDGKNIPNLINTSELTNEFDQYLPKLRAYRKNRTNLHTDDKILTFWNCLMIAALCRLYRVSRKTDYLKSAKLAMSFIDEILLDGDALFVSCRNGKRSSEGFLDDYAGYSLALLSLYEVTLDPAYLSRTISIVNKTIDTFFDHSAGGFYLSGKDNEKLFIRPKESYDGAIPSGNSLMTYIIVRLNLMDLFDEHDILQKQLRFMSGEANDYPAGYGMFLTALMDHIYPPQLITISLKDGDNVQEIPALLSLHDSIIRITDEQGDYPLLDGQTTFYICRNHTCLPPMTKQEFFRTYDLEI